MDTLLHTKIDTVTVGTQMLKRDLFLMEQRPDGRHGDLDENTLEVLFSRVMGLQLDVTALMVRYISVDFRQPIGRVSQVLEELWGVFLILDTMYYGLSILEKRADRTGIHPAELKQLQIYWVKLKRLTKQIKEHLEEENLLPAGHNCSAVH